MRILFQKMRKLIPDCLNAAGQGTPGAGGKFLTVRTWGMSETELESMFREHGSELGVRMGFLARPGRVDLRISGGRGDEMKGIVLRRLEDNVYSIDPNESLESALARRIADSGRVVAVAESCTGGSLGAALTSVPGASEWFVGGIIAYSNRVKTETLGVRESTMERLGAVSLEVAEEMARGARGLYDADLGVGITGIAGPSGGTAQKPVGTVCVAVSCGDDLQARDLLLRGGRSSVRASAVSHALGMMLRACGGWSQ
ncbi:nicotinamide-nucleotide amidohydrolase family protein [Candidatus Fermentibacteria bacterium]|nr:nicotinamide-nucleotide amidohydrolase family protein [Candidatus Fermentibacteria bacterium]